MKRTYITRMPDKSGAFLKASRIIKENNGNIIRVNYNKSVDLHTLFIEVSADKNAHERIESSLTEIGYLKEGEEDKTVLLIVLKIEDKCGMVEPILEVINKYKVNISYLSSQENGTSYQYFKMGLLVDDTVETKKLLDDVAKLCEVKIIEYDVTEKVLDGTVFYISFANEMRELLNLDQNTTNEVLISSNEIMQMLDSNKESPIKAFDYIRRFAKFVVDKKGDNFNCIISKNTLSHDTNVYVIEPPCGSNTVIFEHKNDLLFADCGFACYRKEMLSILNSLFSGFQKRSKSIMLTHGDIDHTGIIDLFDKVYLTQEVLDNFEDENNGIENYREQYVTHKPYCRLSKIISSYKPPRDANFEVIGQKEDNDLFTYVGGIDFGDLHFDAFEGSGGHVKGETVYVCDSEKLILTGDVFVNIKGFSREQKEFNILAPYLMTSVNVDSDIAKAERDYLVDRYKGYTFYPGHGSPITVE